MTCCTCSDDTKVAAFRQGYLRAEGVKKYPEWGSMAESAQEVWRRRYLGKSEYSVEDRLRNLERLVANLRIKTASL